MSLEGPYLSGFSALIYKFNQVFILFWQYLIIILNVTWFCFGAYFSLNDPEVSRTWASR